MANSERMIQTPAGSQAGTMIERLDILGIASYLTQTGNQPQGCPQWQYRFNVEVPIGTKVITVALDTWAIAYGSLDPEFLDPMDLNSHPEWNGDDHHWGFGRVEVIVTDINSPDNTQDPPQQKAEIRVRMNLLDINGDDAWFGIAGYTLTFLGRPKPQATIFSNPALLLDEKIAWGAYSKKERRE